MFDVTLPQANLWFDIFNIVLFVGAFAVAVGTYGTIKMGAVKERFSDERIAANETQTAQANKRTAEIEKSNLLLQQDVERERIERLKLEEKLGPRKIRPEQRSSVLEKLKTAPKGVVFMRPSAADSEPLQFSAQVASILADAGFDVRKWEQGTTLHLGLLGLFIAVRDADTAPAYASAIQRAFTESGILMGGRLVPEFRDGVVAIDVGSKP